MFPRDVDYQEFTSQDVQMKTFKAWESLRFRNGKYRPRTGLTHLSSWLPRARVSLLPRPPGGRGVVSSLRGQTTGPPNTVELKQANRV